MKKFLILILILSAYITPVLAEETKESSPYSYVKEEKEDYTKVKEAEKKNYNTKDIVIASIILAAIVIIVIITIIIEYKKRF